MTLPTASHIGEVRIGGLALPCCVLNDEDATHVFSENALFATLGIKGHGKRHGHRVPSILGKPYIKSLFSAESWMGIKTPIFYTDGGRERIGYKSSILGSIIKVLVQANKAGVLKSVPEKRYAEHAELLRDALVNVAIDALIDEATGYQQIRDKQALEKILDKYLNRELAAWSKKFPDEFYEQLFKLKGWQWKGMSFKRPSVVGTWTNDIVYERLAPGLLKELQSRNPVIETGNRKHKHHQWLTDEVGNPRLRDHLIGVIAIMRASANWGIFERSLARSYPRTHDQLDLLND